MGSMKSTGMLAALVLVTACGATTTGATTTDIHDRLFEATSNHIVVVDATSRTTLLSLPLGTPTADWKHLYSISGTSLVDTDPSTGRVATTIPLGGSYQLPPATATGLPGGLSPNGAWLVAESYDAPAGGAPATTRFVLVDTGLARIVKTISLAGHFVFDAISDDGMRLYLIQYLNGKEYYVRLYDVVSDTLDENIVVDKSNGEQSMTGQRLSGIATPGGGWLFSMYVRESDNPFIHMLSLDGPFAYCLDLPGNGYAANEAERQWSIAMNPAATRLYAVNGATGLVAELDISQQFNPQIVRTQHLPSGKPAAVGSNAAILSPDGRDLVTTGPTGIMWIDTRTLTVGMHALAGWNVWSLALSPDGRMVYAVSDTGRIAAVSIATGAVHSTFNPLAGRPMALLRVAPA